MSDGAGGQSPSEDEIERRLRELSSEIAGKARFHEPSAAERAEAAREQETARDQGAGRRAGRRPPGRGRQVVAWTIAIVVVLAVGGLYGWQRLSGKPASGGPDDTHVVTNGGPDDTHVVTNGAVPPPTSQPSLSPSSSPLGAGPPADPFTGTPADQWADGAAGIVIPAAASHGPFTASEVAAAYATTRKLLIAQDLDPATLRGGAPTAFANLLTAQQRSQFVAGLDKIGLNKNGSAASTRGWVASFAPGTTTLIGAVIKVYGTISARAATDRGVQVLDIDVNYRFVYPVEPPRAPADWMRIVGRVSGYIEFTNLGLPGGPLQPWIVSAVPAEAGGRCYTTDGFIHPDYPNGPPDASQPSGAPINPYSMKTLKLSGCNRTTGT